MKRAAAASRCPFSCKSSSSICSTHCSEETRLWKVQERVGVSEDLPWSISQKTVRKNDFCEWTRILSWKSVSKSLQASSRRRMASRSSHDKFGKFLKLAVHENSTNWTEITVRFSNSKSGDALNRLKQHVDRMKLAAEWLDREVNFDFSAGSQSGPCWEEKTICVETSPWHSARLISVLVTEAPSHSRWLKMCQKKEVHLSLSLSTWTVHCSSPCNVIDQRIPWKSSMWDWATRLYFRECIEHDFVAIKNREILLTSKSENIWNKYDSLRSQMRHHNASLHHSVLKMMQFGFFTSD